MSYEFNAAHSLGQELTRIAGEEFASAIQQLSVGIREDQGTAIHEARKSVKKLRALLRAAADHLHPEHFDAANHGLRDVGRLLSRLRDVQAMRDAGESLIKDHRLDASAAALIRERLNAAAVHQQRGMRAAAAFRRAVAALKDIQATHWTAIQLPDGDWRVLKRGLKRTYKRGRRAMIQAERKQEPEAFHEWRKRVKDHWYHARLLAPLGDAVWDERRKELKNLETMLGDDHNLVLISKAIGDHDKEIKPFLRILKNQSRELRRDALELGDRLYADSWSKLSDHLSSKAAKAAVA